MKNGIFDKGAASAQIIERLDTAYKALDEANAAIYEAAQLAAMMDIVEAPEDIFNSHLQRNPVFEEGSGELIDLTRTCFSMMEQVEALCAREKDFKKKKDEENDKKLRAALEKAKNMPISTEGERKALGQLFQDVVARSERRDGKISV